MSKDEDEGNGGGGGGVEGGWRSMGDGGGRVSPYPNERLATGEKPRRRFCFVVVPGVTPLPASPGQ